MESFDSPFLDFNKEIKIKEKHLILWQQIGKIQHVTFHLKDSIPHKERIILKKLKEDFEKFHPKPWEPETQKAYYKLIGKTQDNLLDNGYGSCIFRNPNLRLVLEDAIKFYSDKYYILLSYVIMPNHVHILLIMEEDYEIDDIFGRIKKFVARKINKITGLNGELWNKEIYCRLMRSEEHYKFTFSYIKGNPKYLKRGEFSYWEVKPES